MKTKKRSRLRRIWEGFLDFLGAILRIALSALDDVV